MTASDKILVDNFFQKRLDELKSAQVDKGLFASGESAKQLSVREDGKVSQLVDGSGSFEFQEFGRGPGSAPPFQKIYDWLAFKKYGLNWENDIKRRGMAWGILMKIKKEGTHTHRTHTPTGVLTDSINKQILEDLINGLISSKSSEIKTDIKRIFE